jgi:Family of unknown function (DUF6353)
MTLSKVFHQTQRVVSNNAPLILTAVGVTGVITTAMLTGKATIKAVRILDEVEAWSEMNDLPPMDIKEKVQRTWMLYLPAVGNGLFTAACIVAANRIGTRRAAALAAAYSLSEKAFVEYKDKVVERLGVKDEQKVRDEIVQDRVNANPVSNATVILTGSGDVLCYDTITGRYFQSNVETLRKAMNDINHQIVHDLYATLDEFYGKIGLDSTKYSSEVGWNIDNPLWIDFTAVLAEDNRPCVAMNYQHFPIREYYNTH